MNTESYKDKYDLNGKRVAVVATDGFEQSELLKPVEALQECGVEVDVITPEGESIRGWSEKNWGQTIKADLSLGEADPAHYDGLLLPGGAVNPDTLRQDPDALAFVKAFMDAGKPVAAICHAPWTLLEAETLSGRTLTSYPSIRGDLRRGGATVVDEEVCRDGNLVTSRNPDDVPAFSAAAVELFAGG